MMSSQGFGLTSDMQHMAQDKLYFVNCNAEEEAKADNVDQLVLLTTRTADWFEQRGFQHAGPAHASPFLPDSRRQQVQHLLCHVP